MTYKPRYEFIHIIHTGEYDADDHGGCGITIINNFSGDEYNSVSYGAMFDKKTSTYLTRVEVMKRMRIEFPVMMIPNPKLYVKNELTLETHRLFQLLGKMTSIWKKYMKRWNKPIF